MLKSIASTPGAGGPATSINPGVPIGNVTPATGAFTTLTSTSATALATATGVVQVGGVAPATWGTGWELFSLNQSAFFDGGAPLGAITGFANNLAHDGTTWRYINTGFGGLVFLGIDGSLRFQNAQSGAAGSPVTPSERFAVSGGGSVAIGVAIGASWLSLRANSTANSGASFGSGPLKTTPASGDVEHSAPDWYLTSTGGRKKIGLTEISGALRVPVTGAARVGGDAVLVAGTVTIPTTAATSTCLANLTRRLIGGTIGELTYTVSAGVSLTINSVNPLDTSTVSFMIMEGF